MQTFATTAPITALVNIPAGRVQFVAADRSDTTVEVLPANPGKARDVKAVEQTNIAYADGVLRVETVTKNQYLGSGAVQVTVSLPTDSRIQATTEAAEVRTVGRLGDVAFTGAYRHIHLEETAGLRLTATDGDVQVGRLGGPAQISTARGDITIAEATGGKVVLSTQSGDITVGAAAGISASLDAGTAHGRISNTLKNNGTAELDIQATTSNGDVTARSL